MVKTDEYEATLRIKLTNAGHRNVKYEAELVLSSQDKFRLQKDILVTALTVSVVDK